jgi:DNA-binding CsgD family transcriptional regulator
MRGAHISLFTNEVYPSYFFENVHDLGMNFYNAIHNASLNELYYYIWPSVPLDDITKSLLNYDIWYGLTVYEKTETYVDAFYFSSDKTRNISHLYFHNLEYLKKFILYIKNKLHILVDLNNKKIVGHHTGEYILDNVLSNKIQYKNMVSNEEVNFFNLISKTNLTKREYEVLQIKNKGFCNKFIANHLNISDRTVETYCKMLHTKMRSHKVVL